MKKKLERKSKYTENVNLPQSNCSISKTSIWPAALLIALVTFLVYLPALKNGFVNWDDDVYVYENLNIRSIDLAFLKWVSTAEVSSLWHPLTVISYAINYAVWKLEPWGYHLTNNLFHTFNTILVFMLVSQLLKQYGISEDRRHKATIIVGSATSLLFGIHPLHVESVAWISERKDVLSAFFYLSSVLAYLKYVSAINSKKRIFYTVSLISFILAIMSKPMAVSLPIVLLILDFYPLGRLTARKGFRSIMSILIEKIPFFLFSFLSSLATMWVHYSKSGLWRLDQIPFTDRVFVAIRAYIFYMVKMVLPVNLSPLYPLPAKVDFFRIDHFGSVLFLTLIVFLSIWFLNKNKLFFAILLYYVVALFPVIGIVQVGVQEAADRYTYLPSIGPFLLVGLGVWYCFERYSKKHTQIAMITALIFIFALLINRSVKQISIWHDSITLWSYEISLYPNTAYIAYNNRGEIYRGLGDYKQALMDYNKAIEIYPNFANAYTNRGIVYYSLNNNQQAALDYTKAIEINPKFVNAYINRGMLYYKLDNYRQAIADFSKAIEIDPANAIPHYARAATYEIIENYHLAIEDYSNTVELNPLHSEAYYHRGVAYNKLGKHRQATIDYRKAASLGSKDAQDILITQRAIE